MLEVNIDKILPITEVRDKFNDIIDQVEKGDDLFVVTKNGKPAAIVVGVHHLEKLTGMTHQELMPDEDYEQERTGATETQPIATTTDDDIFAEPTAEPVASTIQTPANESPTSAEVETQPQTVDVPVEQNVPVADTTQSTLSDTVEPETPSPTDDDIFATTDETPLVSEEQPQNQPTDSQNNAQPSPPADQNL